MNQGAWTAILLAGQRPGENGFAEAHGLEAKALIRVGGEPMLARVARTLTEVPEIGKILVLAQDAEALIAASPEWLGQHPRIAPARSAAGISSSIAALAGSAEAPFPILVTTADHALLRPDMVTAFLAGVGDCDAALAVVERSVVEAAHPDTRRTWLRFRGGDYSGANLFALRTPAAHKALALWSQVERDRKKAFRLLMYFGPLLALRAATRTISLDGALGQVSRRAGLAVRAVRLPYAEAAIDVDKQADLELAETILAARSRQ